MSQAFRIPQGEETVKVELTLKEVMALTGLKFHHNPQLLANARKKLNHLLQKQCMTDHRSFDL